MSGRELPTADELGLTEIDWRRREIRLANLLTMVGWMNALYQRSNLFLRFLEWWYFKARLWAKLTILTLCLPVVFALVFVGPGRRYVVDRGYPTVGMAILFAAGITTTCAVVWAVTTVHEHLALRRPMPDGITPQEEARAETTSPRRLAWMIAAVLVAWFGGGAVVMRLTPWL